MYACVCVCVRVCARRSEQRNDTPSVSPALAIHRVIGRGQRWLVHPQLANSFCLLEVVGVEATLHVVQKRHVCHPAMRRRETPDFKFGNRAQKRRAGSTQESGGRAFEHQERASAGGQQILPWFHIVDPGGEPPPQPPPSLRRRHSHVCRRRRSAHHH